MRNGQKDEPESALRLAALRELPAAVIVYDEGGEILYANRRAEAILEAAGARPSDKVSDLFGFFPHRRRVGAWGSSSAVWVRGGATSLHIGYSVVSLRDEDVSGLRYVLLFQDISESPMQRKQLGERFPDRGHVPPAADDQP